MHVVDFQCFLDVNTQLLFSSIIFGSINVCSLGYWISYLKLINLFIISVCNLHPISQSFLVRNNFGDIELDFYINYYNFYIPKIISPKF